jgi:hypothetical protein
MNKYEALVSLIKLLDAHNVEYEIIDRELAVEDPEHLFELTNSSLNWQVLVRLGNEEYSILYGIVGYPPRRVYEVMCISPGAPKFEDPERFTDVRDLVEALIS